MPFPCLFRFRHRNIYNSYYRIVTQLFSQLIKNFFQIIFFQRALKVMLMYTFKAFWKMFSIYMRIRFIIEFSSKIIYVVFGLSCIKGLASVCLPFSYVHVCLYSVHTCRTTKISLSLTLFIQSLSHTLILSQLSLSLSLSLSCKFDILIICNIDMQSICKQLHLAISLYYYCALPVTWNTLLRCHSYIN